jgi:hypothetical protein
MATRPRTFDQEINVLLIRLHKVMLEHGHKGNFIIGLDMSNHVRTILQGTNRDLCYINTVIDRSVVEELKEFKNEESKV